MRDTALLSLIQISIVSPDKWSQNTKARVPHDNINEILCEINSKLCCNSMLK